MVNVGFRDVHFVSLFPSGLIAAWKMDFSDESAAGSWARYMFIIEGGHKNEDVLKYYKEWATTLHRVCAS